MSERTEQEIVHATPVAREGGEIGKEGSIDDAVSSVEEKRKPGTRPLRMPETQFRTNVYFVSTLASIYLHADCRPQTFANVSRQCTHIVYIQYRKYYTTKHAGSTWMKFVLVCPAVYL
jgi:hypothetical protein